MDLFYIFKEKVKSWYEENYLLRKLLYLPVKVYSLVCIYYKIRILEPFFSYKYYGTLRVYRMNDLTIGIRKLGVKKTRFPHPIGMVVGIGVQIGDNCTIYQNVTIGTKTQFDADNGIYPKLGSNVIVGCNAVIMGNVNIGDNAIVGAGAVVNRDVPANCMAVGNPCKIILK